MNLSHRIAAFWELVQLQAVAFIIDESGKEYPLQENSGRNKNGERRWFLGRLGKRCAFSADTLEIAIQKAKEKLKNHLENPQP